MQCHQQPRRRHDPRIRREHPGHVGPYLEPTRLQFRRHVGGRRIRAAPAQQHGLSLRITRDETLRQDDLPYSGHSLLQLVLGCMLAGCRQVAATTAPVRPARAQEHVAGIHPFGCDAGFVQISGSEARRHQFAEGHDADTHPHAHFTYQSNARDQLVKFVKMVVE